MENNIPDQPQPPVVVDQNAISSPTNQKNSKRIILIAIVMCIALIIIFGSFFIYSNNSNVAPTVTPGMKAPVITPVPTIPSAIPIKMSLTKGKIVTVPTTNVTIEYIGAVLPNPKCFDCISTTDLALVKDDIRKILSYSCGGIAGKCTDKVSEYGLEVTLENSTDSTAQVSIKKQ